MTLYEIITKARAATGSKEKTAVLMEHKDNALLASYLKAVNDPAISYYIASVPYSFEFGDVVFDQNIINSVLITLAGRHLTGNAAREWLAALMNNLNTDGQFLLSLLIDRKIGEGIGDSIVLKVFPSSFFQPMYSRCALMTPKIKEAFDAMPHFFCQVKMDGCYAWATKDSLGVSSLISRQGNHFPEWLSNKILEGIPDGHALAGELLVHKDGVLLNRQIGNGIFNSILAGDEETARHSEYTYTLTAWDAITYEEFSIHKESKSPYEARFKKTTWLVEHAPNMRLVETTIVHSLDEAYKIYARYLAEGKEGVIIKSPHGVLKDNTSKDNVKLKLAFMIDLELTEMHYGEKGSKYEHMLGAMTLSSSDGLLVSGCGTGLTDNQRDFSLYKIGEIFTIKANDIISREGSDILSLNLPVFIESRKHDKKVADSLPHIYSQRDAAKLGVKAPH